MNYLSCFSEIEAENLCYNAAAAVVFGVVDSVVVVETLKQQMNGGLFPEAVVDIAVAAVVSGVVVVAMQQP